MLGLIIIGSIVITSVVVVIWLFIALKKESSGVKEQDVVPITDLNEIKKTFQLPLKNAFNKKDKANKNQVKAEPVPPAAKPPDQEQGQGSSPASARLLEDPLMKSLKVEPPVFKTEVSVEEGVKKTDPTEDQKKVFELQEQVRVTNERLLQETEVAASKISALMTENDRIKKEQEQNVLGLKQLEVAKNQLREFEQKNHLLQEEATALQARLKELEEKNKSLEGQADASIQLKELEEKAKSYQQQLDVAKAKETEAQNELSAVKIRLEQEVKEAQDMAEQLKSEQQANIQKALDEQRGAFDQKEAGIAREIEKEFQQRLDDLTKTLQNLKAEQAVFEAQNQELKESIEKLKKDNENNPAQSETLSQLQSEKEALAQEKKKLEDEFQNLKQSDQVLVEKTKLIQSELTKTRAQSIGLEKICANFKIQLEEIRKENEELLKKVQNPS